MGNRSLDYFKSDSQYHCFINETEAYLPFLCNLVSQINEYNLRDESFKEIFRIVHTIKGSAMILGVDEISEIAHKIESYLLLDSSHRSSKSEVETELFQFIHTVDSWIKKRPSNSSLAFPKNCITSIFPKLEVLINSLSKELDKKIDLNISIIEFDFKSEHLQLIENSLMHLLRNACDHGALDSEQREAKGKSPVNQLNINVSKANSNIIIRVSDDGEGIDFKRLNSEFEKNKSDLDDATKRADIDEANLLFLPFLSTRKEVSKVSGRGLGLDIVKRNIEKLSGGVEVISSPGRGATFILSIPIKD